MALPRSISARSAEIRQARQLGADGSRQGLVHDPAALQPARTFAKRPWLVAFAFGLLHGLGFAGALSELALPSGDIPLALLFFNVGVEIGQLMFIASVIDNRRVQLINLGLLK